jgi:hypothetical protein
MNGKAQFIIVAALLIGIMVTSLAVSIYLTATQYQEFRYQASKEIIINIDKDFKRALTRILALATHNYNKSISSSLEKILKGSATGKCEEIADFNEKLSYWCQTLLQSYLDAGLQLSYGGNLLKYCWLYNESFSAIYSELEVNLTSYGLYGFVSEGRIQLNVTIDSVSAEKKGKNINITLTFHVEREYGEPVSSLSKDNYNFTDQDTLAGWAISYNETTNWKQPEKVNITYSAGGKYTIIFEMEEEGSNPGEPPRGKPPGEPPGGREQKIYLVLWIRDERGILVVALANVTV